MGLFGGLLGHGTEVDAAKLAQRLDGVLLDNEQVHVAFKVIRDLFVFTSARLILIDVQGIRGKKVSYLTIPYRAITRFSVETAGTFDLEAELKVWISGSDKPIERTLTKGTDIRGLQRALAWGVLK
ncbi:hypothetical protein FHS85_001253 [Rhodoligotrophos appendicifer]|uniref:PH domain-containing protein n=1 Tax=Rhodoligotrophos appendicifer TaxID=987056 RepID=UPI0011868DFD|nr:PH domain-containing protein [Rhodoligotrophos appendicifer]